MFLRPPWVCRHFLWLVAALLSGFSLSFASGAVFSSPQLLLRLCLRYADWLSLRLCIHGLLGLRVSWPSCLSLSLQLALVLQVPVGSLLPYGSHPLRWGHPCGVETCLSSIGTKVSCVPLSLLGCFFMLSLPLGFWSPNGSVLVGSCFCTTAGTPGHMLEGLEPLSETPLSALSLRGCFRVVLAEDDSLRLSFALSGVLPCPVLWLHVCLHGTCSGPKVVLGALP